MAEGPLRDIAAQAEAAETEEDLFACWEAWGQAPTAIGPNFSSGSNAVRLELCQELCQAAGNPTDSQAAFPAQQGGGVPE